MITEAAKGIDFFNNFYQHFYQLATVHSFLVACRAGSPLLQPGKTKKYHFSSEDIFSPRSEGVETPSLTIPVSPTHAQAYTTNTASIKN